MWHKRRQLMKRKLIITVIATLLAVGIVATLTACSPNYVNVGGSYRTATEAEISAFLSEVPAEPTGGYKLYYYAESSYKNEYMMVKVDGQLDQADKLIMAISYEMKVKAATEPSSAEMSMYSDGDYIYVKSGDLKTKTAADLGGSSITGSSSAVGIPPVPYENIIDLIRSNENCKCSIAQSGMTKKLKVELNFSDLGVDIGVDTADLPVTYYIVMENGKLTGVAAKCDGSVEYQGSKIKVKIDIQLGATSDNVKLPSDLSTYTETGI